MDPEDLDGFEDTDGCPDPDNDGDGVGVAKALLDAACEALRLAGCVAVDAWTQLDAPNLAAMHTGPLALYERAGFAKLREVDGRWVMRKPLTP